MDSAIQRVEDHLKNTPLLEGWKFKGAALPVVLAA
jgi:hypothetical protein